MSRECTFAGAAHCKLSTAGVFSKVVGDGAHIGSTETENLSLPHFSRTESKVETHLFPVFGGKYISCDSKGSRCNGGKDIQNTSPTDKHIRRIVFDLCALKKIAPGFEILVRCSVLSIEDPI